MKFFRYKNGNYTVTISPEDGTKIRHTDDDEFDAEFPENIDIKTTNWCKRGCEFCHERSSVHGKHSDVFVLNAPKPCKDTLASGYAFLDTLRPYTEVACGGGSITSWPYLDFMLKFMKDKRIFANITVHMDELLENQERIQSYIDNELVKGVGVSVGRFDKKVFDFARKNPNVVLHVIAGYHDVGHVQGAYGLAGLKLLILGYKNWGRGKTLLDKDPTFHKELEKNLDEWESKLDVLREMFKVVAFDNLALEQLHVKDHVDADTWSRFYMGDDAKHTMYIDLVKKEYAANSTSRKRYKLLNNIDDMFRNIKGTMSEGK